jgi:hypothetical protein
MLGDVMGVELTIQCSDGCDDYGEPLKPFILDFVTQGNINAITERAAGGSYTNDDGSSFDRVINFSTAAAHVGWDIILLLTGTYIFSFMYLMGVPMVIVTGIILIYALFLVRAIVGYIRGV